MKVVQLVFVLILGLILGTSVPDSQGKPAEKAKSRFQSLELFNKVLYQIELMYYRPVDQEKLIQGAIQGMMATLDPHSGYLNKKIYKRMQTDTSGEFGGLGIEVTQTNGVIIIITPLDDTPAFKAGLLAGDKIVEINNEETLGLHLEEAVELMRGKPDSKVQLGIVRDGVEGIKRYSLKREFIKIKAVKSGIVKDNYAYLRLTQFQKGSAREIEKAYKKLQAKMKKGQKIKGLVFDLRSNPGGLLDEAVEVSSLFASHGIVVSTEGRDPKNREIRYVKKGGFKILDLPIVVLINGASASASEIVAGALQDWKRAIIMGAQSFGKGSVQTVSKIDSNTGIKLTIAQYMTPNGRKIQALGITPDIEVEEINYTKLDQIKDKSHYVREKDLRNHLVSVIENKQEKQARLKNEKEKRKKLIKEIEDRNRRAKRKKREKDVIYKRYDPQSDYQVLQAVNYLKSFKVFRDFVKK